VTIASITDVNAALDVARLMACAILIVNAAATDLIIYPIPG